MAPSTTAAHPTRLLTPRRAVITLLLAVSVGALVLGFQSHQEESDTVEVRDAAVSRVFPRPGDINVRQDAVGYELAFGYTGVLQIDRVEIPEDQIDRIAGINRVSFTPGAAKELESLTAGRHCATAVFWRDSESRERNRTYTWCFNAA